MPAKYTVCAHCGIGWIPKSQKKWYPQCWHCGLAWRNQNGPSSDSEDWDHGWAWPSTSYANRSVRQAGRAVEQHDVQARNTQEDWQRWETQAWLQNTRKPKKQPAWPPGLGWGKSQLTPEEYDEAVASLWKDADPQAQQVLRACGIEPPDEEEQDPRTVLHRYLARYKSITQQHRGLVAKKAQLQLRADKIKAQFEKLVQDLADVSKEIEQAESHLVTVQTQVQTQLKEAEPPKVQDLQGLLKNAGVTLADDQHVALSAYIQTMTQPKIDEEMLDLGEGWFREAIPPDIFNINRAENGNDTSNSFGPSRTSRAGQRSTPLSRGEQEDS